MIEVKVIDYKRMGCGECGRFPKDRKLARIQLVYPHSKADLCLDCLNNLRGRLNDLALNWEDDDAVKPVR